MKFKDIFEEVLFITGSAAFMVAGAFFIGTIGNKMESTIGKQYIQIKRENFKESKSYIEGMVEDLSSAKREYEKTEDPNEKEQIRNMLDSKFSNFDINNIENEELKNFLQDIRGGLK